MALIVIAYNRTLVLPLNLHHISFYRHTQHAPTPQILFSPL